MSAPGEYQTTEQDRKNGVRTVTWNLVNRGVTPEVAHHVLYVTENHDDYVRPGNFVEMLVNAMRAADTANLAALALGFPQYAAAVDAWKNHAAGTAGLRVIASRWGG